jgi:prephenate dehydrogenase
MKLAVIGVGLIGGSFALALKKAKAVSHVIGVGRTAANLELALEGGIIDSTASDAGDAELVLVSAPLGQYPGIFRSLKATKAIITDAGSTKRDVVAAARKALGKNIARFVPGHPIAGAEKSGAAAASADLFRDRRVVLTPLKENDDAAVSRIRALWQACGARVSTMTAEEHDELLATVSHLPHLLAFGLVHEVAKRRNSEQLFSFAAGGFRDFTRIASSHPEMWRDICLANRDLLLSELKKYRGKVIAIERLLQAGDGAALEKLFTEARRARDQWLKSSS